MIGEGSGDDALGCDEYHLEKRKMFDPFESKLLPRLASAADDAVALRLLSS